MNNIENEIQNIDYKNVLHYFAKISSVPRGSGNNKGISDYLVDFAKKRNLEYVQDELLNVIIRKPASQGMEDKTGVIIQGHMDMVCVTEEGVTHNFETEPLDLFLDGDLLGAKGTTLGGDDGIAVAIGLALLDDDTIQHPSLELVVTTDEETGMFGAKALDTNLLNGRFLINIDSEEEGTVLVSCAGGMRVYGKMQLDRQEREGVLISISIAGLQGGHSGAEIDKYRTNAVYEMARLLFEADMRVDFSLVDFNGGEKDNAIPNSAHAVIAADAEDSADIIAVIHEIFDIHKKELFGHEPNMSLGIMAKEGSGNALTSAAFGKLMFLMMQAPNGVQVMSAQIKGLVESSLNLGIFRLTETEAQFHYSLRSSVSSYKYFMRDKLIFLFEVLGAECECDSEYPAWEYREESKLRDTYCRVFKELYGRDAKVEAIHAGLECGLISEQVPDMDIISIGPNMKDIHTPNERLSVSSSVRVYQFLEKLIAEL